jgi:two-component system response regulator HydG
MLASFSEFKFYQSFRVKVEQSDDLRFLVENYDSTSSETYIDDAKLVDISTTGIGFSSKARISVGTEIDLSLQFRRHHIDISGRIVRAFTDGVGEETIVYGIEIEKDKKVNKFLEQYITSFSSDRLKDCLLDIALKERYAKATDGFEMFSLLLSLYKDITNFGDKDGFVDNMLEEVVRLLNAQRASIFLINPESNKLEAIAAMGVNKDTLKFDYRMGIAGSVFTTGVALNIDTVNDSTRFNDKFDKKSGFETKSIICHPIHNREDKIIGVIEILNKRNQDRFTVDDEKTMKVISLIFSSVFHNFNPISELSQIRRFSTPFDRDKVLIGKTSHLSSIRNTINKMKDIDVPMLIHGELGVGKLLFANILHTEGQRGLNNFVVVDCDDKNIDNLESYLWGPENICKLIECQGGTLVFKNIHALGQEHQKKLFKILIDRRLPDGKASHDFRLIATTSEDLGLAVEVGTFDEELYEYISKSDIYIEALRRRVEDIPELINYFFKLECKNQGLLLKNFSEKVMTKLTKYDWPGNIAELRKCVERAVLYNPKKHVINHIDLDDGVAPLVDLDVKRRQFGTIPHVTDHSILLKDRLALVEREMIQAEIKRNNGNKSKAAKEMGISREALRKKLLLSQDVVDKLTGIDESVHEEVEKAA